MSYEEKKREFLDSIPKPPKGAGSSIKSPKDVQIHIHIHVNNDAKSPHELAEIISDQIKKNLSQQGLL